MLNTDTETPALGLTTLKPNAEQATSSIDDLLTSIDRLQTDAQNFDLGTVNGMLGKARQFSMLPKYISRQKRRWPQRNWRVPSMKS